MALNNETPNWRWCKKSYDTVVRDDERESGRKIWKTHGGDGKEQKGEIVRGRYSEDRNGGTERLRPRDGPAWNCCWEEEEWVVRRRVKSEGVRGGGGGASGDGMRHDGQASARKEGSSGGGRSDGG